MLHLHHCFTDCHGESKTGWHCSICVLQEYINYHKVILIYLLYSAAFVSLCYRLLSWRRWPVGVVAYVYRGEISQGSDSNLFAALHCICIIVLHCCTLCICVHCCTLCVCVVIVCCFSGDPALFFRIPALWLLTGVQVDRGLWHCGKCHR